MAFDRRVFFDKVRRPLFGGRLRQSQVDGLSAVLDGLERWLPAGGAGQAAYVLATAHHETGGALAPIEERGDTAYFKRLYDIEGERPAVARRLGNGTPGDGVRFRGRGFVQITGRDNYRRFSERLGIDLVASPDMALREDIAVRILVEGMRDGVFTGRALREFVEEGTEDFVGARRVVNGRDKAEEVAGYARLYLAALRAEEEAGVLGWLKRWIGWA
jgi:hypothetical protein